MKTKFTKGEWTLIRDKSTGVYAGGNLIITCWSARDTDDSRLDGESWLEMRKRTEIERCINDKIEPSYNAQLISAAPDLFEALISIENDDNRIPSTIWEMRNKALNKALGEEYFKTTKK